MRYIKYKDPLWWGLMTSIALSHVLLSIFLWMMKGFIQVVFRIHTLRKANS